MSDVQPHERISVALSTARAADRVGLVPFITAGYPDKARFIDTLELLSTCSEVVEIGVPFSDPLADGVTIQRASRKAIEAGVSLAWIIDQLDAARSAGKRFAPLVLMSYMNPLYIYGFDRLSRDAAAAGVCGFIVPDLPLEEGGEFRAALAANGLGQVQLITPTTPADRVSDLCQASRGFIYAVTVSGITGGAQGIPADVSDYLDRVKAQAADTPVCAGFGVREPAQVASLGRHADGVIVGSALVEQLEAGHDPQTFLKKLRSRDSDPNCSS